LTHWARNLRDVDAVVRCPEFNQPVNKSRATAFTQPFSAEPAAGLTTAVKKVRNKPGRWSLLLPWRGVTMPVVFLLVAIFTVAVGLGLQYAR
jgi:hypothetical protein